MRPTPSKPPGCGSRGRSSTRLDAPPRAAVGSVSSNPGGVRLSVLYSIALPFQPRRHRGEVDSQHRALPGRTAEHARMHEEAGASVLLE
jgi:hypothetical protein